MPNLLRNLFCISPTKDQRNGMIVTAEDKKIKPSDEEHVIMRNTINKHKSPM